MKNVEPNINFGMRYPSIKVVWYQKRKNAEKQ